jgi:hypothetical protein
MYWSYLIKEIKILTVVLDTEHEAHYLQIEPNRWFCRFYSQKIVKSAAKRTRRVAPGEDMDFSGDSMHTGNWRKSMTGSLLNGALSLTRMSLLVSWIINHYQRFARDSLKGTLEASRKAVQTSEHPNEKPGDKAVKVGRSRCNCRHKFMCRALGGALPESCDTNVLTRQALQ